MLVSAANGENCFTTITDDGYNLTDSHGDCGLKNGTTDMTNTDPLLDTHGLQDNGGPTQTMALQQGSPAIDAVPTSSGLCPATDQRGNPRPDEGESFCDIGVYESAYKVATTASLGSSANPSVLGQSVTFTATVSVPSPGAGTPTGTVDFYDGTTKLGSAPLTQSSPDVVTFQISGLTVGSHSITAAYEGDSNFRGSTSSALSQAVSYGGKQVAVANNAGKLAVTVQLQNASGTNVSSSSIPVTALRIVDNNNQTAKTLNAPFTFTITGPAGFVGGVYAYATSTGLPHGTYALVYRAGNDPTTHSVSFSF